MSRTAPAPEWTPTLHPRGESGRFVDKPAAAEATIDLEPPAQPPEPAQEDPAPPIPGHAMAWATFSRDYDQDQVQAMFARSWSRNTAKIVTPKLAGNWVTFCNGRARAAHDPQLAAEYARMATEPILDAHMAKALMGMNEREYRGMRSYRGQVAAVSAVRGVSRRQVDEYLLAARAQYAERFAGLDPQDRPDPPAEWVRGFTTRNWDTRYCPDDPASLYAFYRAENDPDSFGPEGGRRRRFASVDLETAGPSGRAGFEPENGHIIEVAVSTYDEHGAEVDSWACLVRPGPEAETTYRTGAVDVHGIEWEDVADAPAWSEVAPQVGGRLQATTLLAQNSPFENRWLDEHMGRAGQPFDRDIPTVDTLKIAQTNFGDLPNHKLATVCEHVGVRYDDGHRAEHDARVAARAYFSIRQIVRTRYLDDERFAGLEHPLG